MKFYDENICVLGLKKNYFNEKMHLLFLKNISIFFLTIKDIK